MKALAVISGGLDSSVAAWKTAVEDNGIELTDLVTFNYGQRHRHEIYWAMRFHLLLMDRLEQEIRHEVLHLNKIKRVFEGSALTSYDVEVPEGHYADESMKATVVPNRNMVFISLAGALAKARGCGLVVVGVHAGDHPIYPDCRPDFIAAATSALLAATEVQLAAPFVDIDKAEIVRIGASLKFPFDLTYSCYKGGERHCGKCGTCVERREAFELAEVEDPTIYEEAE